MKNNLIFISAVEKNNTPVLDSLIAQLSHEFNCILIVYKHKKIFSYVKASLCNILRTKNRSALIFIGIQSLPILFLFQFVNTNKYYWALENYKFKFFHSSLSQKILAFEYFIFWRNVNLIIPSKYRGAFYNLTKYKSTLIIENTPPLGQKVKNRVLSKNRIKFVMYGRLCNDDIYLKEFISIIGKNPNLAELHLIGWDFILGPEIKPFANIFHHGALDHSSLISLLDSFDVSIIGYRPYKFNNEYCAPNKLYEAFSISLPVLANTLNPPLLDIVSTYKCGILADFSKLEDSFETLVHDLRRNYDDFKVACYHAYQEQYHIENYIHQFVSDNA